MTKARWPTGLTALLLLAALFYAIFIGRTMFRIDGQIHFTLIDDAMISMRYAQHLAAGQGLVWNIGDHPVQGFSNPGWVVVMAALHLLPLSPAVISLGMMLVSAAILLLHAGVLAAICGEVGSESGVAPLMAATIAAFYFPLVFWSLRGMEVGALGLLIGAGTLQALRLRRESNRGAVILALLLAAAVLIRLDGLLQAGLVLLYTISARQPTRTQVVLLVGILLLAVAGILAFQLSYFGDVLPNTYYQKLAGASIATRTRAGILAFYQYAARDVVMMVLVSAAGIWFYKKLQNRQTLLFACLFLVQCLYSIWVGGDYAEPEVAAANRFITQGVPALVVLFSLVIDRVFSDLRRSRSGAAAGMQAGAGPLAVAAAAATLLVISGTPWMSWAIDNPPLLKADIRRVRAGLAIAASTAPDVTIAVHAAGQIPYYSARRTIDLLGLNDPFIAREPRGTSFYPGHDKWNYEYSITGLQPDLIADNWIRLSDFIKGRPDYRQLDNGMYVRVGAMGINEAVLLAAYP